MSFLRNNPDASFDRLVAGFLDSGKDKVFRSNCAQLIREIGRPLSKRFDKGLEAILATPDEDSLLQADAALFLLSRGPNLNRATRKLIGTRMREKYRSSRQERERAYIRLKVFPLLQEDVDIEEFLVDQLSQGNKEDVGPTLQVLGKMRSRRAIIPIRRLLERNWNNAEFPRTRAYLALGQIGGDSAFGILVDSLRGEKDTTERNMILFAVGLTKSRHAKRFLLNFAERESVDHFTAVLQGLRFLGDTSVVPVLKKRQSSEGDPVRREYLQKAIEVIEGGGELPPW